MRVAVLVSGGVDSSVALALLKAQGYEVVAFYLKIWLEDELSYLGECPWQEDLNYITQVCEQLKVPLQIVSLQKEYHQEVVGYTIAEVKAGRTPNPDMLCNQQIKFGLFLKHLPAEFDKVASGHYAQVIEKNGLFHLYSAPDLVKDQTYFLARLNQKHLSKILFPIGHLQKAEVRALAHQLNLPNKARKDSQGICFLGKFKYSDFIKHHLGEKEGLIIEYETGMVLGKHKGFWYHTIGQRQGSGLAGGPWYVVDKMIEKNIVYMSRNYHSADKQRNAFIVDHLNWIIEQPEQNSMYVKLRHGPNKYRCTILPCVDNTNKIQVNLEMQDQGIASGQFAVFYQNDECIGSGIIE